MSIIHSLCHFYSRCNCKFYLYFQIEAHWLSCQLPMCLYREANETFIIIVDKIGPIHIGIKKIGKVWILICWNCKGKVFLSEHEFRQLQKMKSHEMMCRESVRLNHFFQCIFLKIALLWFSTSVKMSNKKQVRSICVHK